MMDDLLKLFILGITVSFGPCIAHCSMVILPYISSSTNNWKEGLRVILIFSFSRLIVYGLLGLLTGLVGRIIIEQLRRFEFYIMIAGGLFILSLGIYILLRKNDISNCQSHKCKQSASIKNTALLGVFTGILPCLPVLGVLTFTMLYAQNLWQSTLYCLAFGAGKIFSPLILLGILAGSAPALLSRYNRAFNYFKKFSGFVLIIIGAQLTLHGIFSLL